jgi:aminoglycoside 3-N-acetyltransferase
MSLFETLSGLALRTLRADQFTALRDRYQGLRQRLAPAMRFVHGSFGTDDLRRHLAETVGGDFEVLMVHCSVNNLQPMYTGTPLDLLKMLIEFCGPRRTLAMPAFYFGEPEAGNLAATFAKQPRFDVRRVPSQMGLLSELFRRTRGVACSRHPIYRVSALGPLAEQLLRGHETAELPCGVGSPFDAMTRHDTLILGIGKPFEVLTHVHHAEDLMGEDFPVPAAPVNPIAVTLVDGKEEIPCVLRGRTLTWKRDMRRLRGIMSPESLREWKFHGVPLFATRAAEVSRAVIDAARSGRTIYVAP